MSATFWNLRRKKAKKKRTAPAPDADTRFSEMTKKEIVEALAEKGVPAPDRANKETLLALLREASGEE